MSHYLITFDKPYPMGHVHERGRAHRLHAVIVAHSSAEITELPPFVDLRVVAVVEMEHTWSTSGADEHTITHHWQKEFRLIVSRNAIRSITPWTSDRHENWAPA